MDFLKMIFYFIIFLIILYGAYFVCKHIDRFSFGYSKSRYMKVVDRLMLTRDKSMTIVKIGDKNLLIGLTKDGLNLMRELNESEMLAIEESFEKPSNPVPMNEDIVTRIIKKGIPFFQNFFKRFNKANSTSFQKILVKKLKSAGGLKAEAGKTDEK